MRYEGIDPTEVRPVDRIKRPYPIEPNQTGADFCFLRGGTDTLSQPLNRMPNSRIVSPNLGGL